MDQGNIIEGHEHHHHDHDHDHGAVEEPKIVVEIDHSQLHVGHDHGNEHAHRGNKGSGCCGGSKLQKQGSSCCSKEVSSQIAQQGSSCGANENHKPNTDGVPKNKPSCCSNKPKSTASTCCAGKGKNTTYSCCGNKDDALKTATLSSCCSNKNTSVAKSTTLSCCSKTNTGAPTNTTSTCCAGKGKHATPSCCSNKKNSAPKNNSCCAGKGKDNNASSSCCSDKNSAPKKTTSCCSSKSCSKQPVRMDSCAKDHCKLEKESCCVNSCCATIQPEITLQGDKACSKTCCKHKRIVVPMDGTLSLVLRNVTKPDLESGGTMVASTISIKGICCKDKAHRVSCFLIPMEGILNVEVDNTDYQSLVIEHDCKVITCESIVDLLNFNDLHAVMVVDGAVFDSSSLVESIFSINGMCCASEARICETVLLPLDGVFTVRPNVLTKTLTVKHRPGDVKCVDMLKLLNEQRLDASVIQDGSNMDIGTGKKVHVGANSRFPKWNIVLGLFLWLLSLLHYVKDPEYMQYFKYVALGAIALTLPPIILIAWARLTKCSLDINVLMSLAVVGAIALGEYSEGAAVITLYSLSGWLEGRATQRVRAAVTELVTMAPETAELAQDGGLGPQGTIVPVEIVPVGTRLIVRDGAKFPLDGFIVNGNTFADESALTGESVPVKKRPDDRVSGGTINVGSYVEMESTTIHADSAVSRMVRLIEEANLARAPTQQFVEKVARIYTPTVFVIALLLASIPWAFGNDVGKQYLDMALVLLVVACPCALVISTPITYVCGLAKSAKKGILIKGGLHLETLAKVKTMCMDKTGTVTLGKFNLVHFRRVNDDDNDDDDGREENTDLFRMIFEAERGSPHPLAAALCAAAQSRIPPGALETSPFQLHSLETLKGEGIHACFRRKGEDDAALIDLFVGNARLAERLGWTEQAPACVESVRAWEQAEALTAGWVGFADGPVAIYGVGDTIRPDAAESIEELKKLGLDVIMLTGDNEGSAASIAREVHINTYCANLLPENKVERIKSIENVVAMIGDGVNDAPSLAAASVSISLGCIGSAVALETADIALMNDKLSLLPKCIRIGRLCGRKIFQNIAFSVLSKFVVLVITLTVYPSLWLAIFVDVGGMLLVTLNSMSILGGRSRKQANIADEWKATSTNQDLSKPFIQGQNIC